ncbi:MAG TPA: alanine racemase, partial [Ktedonobacteraceae bacterium]|nr:alanine racemase [Ktedonobacteraceae bacterium]
MIFLDHLLAATGGVLRYTGKQNRFDAFSHDTRQLIPGELFVAVHGERGDGHDYLDDAVKRGAAGLLVEARYINALAEEAQATIQQAGVATIVVQDTRIALQQYARFVLKLWHPTVIAVTGSTGKTSTKEAIASALAGNFATFRSWQNYNDLLGLPLSLGRLEERHEYAVLEMSCDHPGEIRDLCDIAQPRIGVLTNISPAQLQYFGNVERLAAELTSLLTYLPKEGGAIVNVDDALVRGIVSGTSVDYEHLGVHPALGGLPQGADKSAVGAMNRPLRADSIVAPVVPFAPSVAQNVKVTWQGIQFDALVHLSSHLLGAHHVSTMLAAYTVGRYCGLNQDDIAHALANVYPMQGRLNPLPGIHGSMLLDDTHNATPASVIAGLETLKTLPSHCRVAILGDMLRLGDYEEEAHRQVGQKAASCADYLILRGKWASVISESARQSGLAPERIIITSTHEDAAKVAKHFIEKSPFSKSTILIKGSEETRMERVTETLMVWPEQAPGCLVRQTPGWKQIVVMRPERPTWVEIDLSAIANNTRQIQALVGPRVHILASLKADAYGHGALKVARTVLHNGASMLGVATVSEATPLRDAGISASILVFGYVPLWQMREAVRLGLSITLYSIESAQALSRAAVALGKVVNVHVKIDSGMGRLGIRAEQSKDVIQLINEITDLPGLALEGIFTHFAMADTTDMTHAHLQLNRFLHVLSVLEEKKIRPPLVHAANSAAIIHLPEAHFDMVRPGIALYGLDPSAEVRLPQGFRPALSFKTQVAQVKAIPTGECISYGCTYITERSTTVAVLPVGYADGFRRAPTNWGTVLIHGQEA